MTTPVVPGYVPFALLLVLEAVCIVAALLAATYDRFQNSSDALQLCTRCGELHGRTEIIGRAADAVAAGALAFFAALPFVAAAYEGGATPARIALGASAVVAVLAVAAEGDFILRSIASLLAPNLRWNATLSRIVGGGARWAGVIFAVYIFKAGYTGAGGTAPGMTALFGGIGNRIAADLGSTVAVWIAAILLVVSAAAALIARWLLPFVFNSLPATLAARRDAQRTGT